MKNFQLVVLLQARAALCFTLDYSQKIILPSLSKNTNQADLQRVYKLRSMIAGEETFHSSSPIDQAFDQIIGELEDVLMDERFIDLCRNFFEKYYNLFTRDDENKLVYTTIFKEYVQLIESFLDSRLKSRLSWFQMDEFLASRLNFNAQYYLSENEKI